MGVKGECGVLPDASSPGGAIQAIKNAITHAKTRFWLLGWGIMIALIAQSSLRYYSGSSSFDHQIDRAIIIGGFAILLISALVHQTKGGRRERYADVTGQTHRALHELRDLQSYLLYHADGPDEGKYSPQLDMNFRGRIEIVLDLLSDIFTTVSSAQCRIAIKLVEDAGDKLYVFTFARDAKSIAKSAASDKRRHEEKLDTIEENEDFHQIFDRRDPFFFCGDLARRSHHKNTSFKIYGTPHQGGWYHAAFPSLWWTLPYRSVIVWPIQQLDARHLNFEPLGCIGFLAVDCAVPNRFREQSDVPLGAGIADAMFHCFRLWNALRAAPR